MSDPAWRAVLVHTGGLTVWEVSASGEAGTAPPLPRATLSELTGPLVVAGLDVTPVQVPARPLTHTTALPSYFA